jgi:hypothetical protein
MCTLQMLHQGDKMNVKWFEFLGGWHSINAKWNYYLDIIFMIVSKNSSEQIFCQGIFFWSQYCINRQNGRPDGNVTGDTQQDTNLSKKKMLSPTLLYSAMFSAVLIFMIVHLLPSKCWLTLHWKCFSYFVLLTNNKVFFFYF